MLIMLVFWAALFAVLAAFVVGQPRAGGALILAYFIGLSMIHIPGALVFLGQGSTLPNAEETVRGFQLTLIGMTAFVVGAFLATRWHKGSADLPTASIGPRVQPFEVVGFRLMMMGLVAYFVLIPLSFRVASLTAPIASLGALLVIGLWLRLYRAEIVADRARKFRALAIVPLLPFATVVSGGFISYGTYWALTTASFLFVIAKRRIWFYLMTLPVIYLGLSLFVTYMGERTGIREIVQQQAAISERITRVSTIITEFQLLDLDSPAHSRALNDRLNQNWLVGAGIIRHEDGLTDLAYGSTIP